VPSIGSIKKSVDLGQRLPRFLFDVLQTRDFGVSGGNNGLQPVQSRREALG